MSLANHIMMLLVASIALLPSRAASAQQASFDASTGALVLPGLIESLRNDPADRVAAPMPDRTIRYFQPPWMVAGIARTSQRIRALVAESISQGRKPSVVLLPTKGPIAWSWISSPELVRIGSDLRSAPVRVALGTGDLRGIATSGSMKAAATTVLRSMVATAVSQAAAPAMKATAGGVPVIIVEQQTASAADASTLIAQVVGAKVPVIHVGMRASAVVARVRNAVAEFQARARAIAAVKAPNPGSVTAPPPLARSADIPAAAANWVPEGSAWNAVLANGSSLVNGWVPGTVAPQADHASRIRPTAQVQAVPGGLRVVLAYRNGTGSVAELSSASLPTFRLGNSIRIQDTRDVGGTVPLTPETPTWRGTYPEILYAPACILRNDSVAVGVSIEYPVMEYRHDIRLRCTPVTGGAWSVELGMENSTAHCGYSYLRNCPTLQPGEQREYVVNIQVSGADDWIQTLQPYRAFFQAKYGAAAYVRDPRPVAGVALSQLESLSPSNPNGWVPGIGLPERDGFGGASSLVESRFRDCSDRVMIWAPTGYSTNPKANYPFQFATRWASYPRLAPDIDTGATVNLRALALTNGRTMGLWWGHAANPSYAWGEDPVRSLRSSDRAMRDAWFRELDAAVATGASEIGLDAFAHEISPVWELAAYLRDAKARYPQLRFCIERRAADILHVLAPTWIDGYKSSPLFNLPTVVVSEPFVIADYLIPGQETWVGMQFNLSKDPLLWGTGASLDAQQAAVANIANLGYVPVTWVPMWLKQPTGSPTIVRATH
jgi:hypothetical protein